MQMFEDLDNENLFQVRTACAYLFSPALSKNDKFIMQLKPEMVKTAFRKKAKMYHPDLHRNETKDVFNRRKERFIKIQESYETLSTYIKKFSISDNENETPAYAPKIIAVGGAKGGVGKSILAANLGVLLSSLGHRTVVADLDLGGANLHLYLGEAHLKQNINDFINNKVSTLDEIMVQSKYGPLLIGGNSSQLGAANINFSRKLKLLRTIKKISADYVIIDLGGDTSYNIIDFYLAADYGIVITTCDPAAYLDAYSFIKVALFRKLNRIFGPESTIRTKKDQDLEHLIKEATLASNNSKVRNIKGLIERVRQECPQHLSLIKDSISAYHPYLIVNRTTSSDMNVNELVERIQTVSSEQLSTKIKNIGTIPFQSEIESSARDLIPVVYKYPTGDLAINMNKILKKLNISAAGSHK